jgi:cytochrome c biogenesis protein CcdA
MALSALTVGFLVSVLEAVCTGQVYLPTITFVLKATPLKLHALGYLALYNIMFIVPLFVIFLFALLGATSEDFSRFMKRHLAAIKLLMAVLFFALGIFLLWRP